MKTTFDQIWDLMVPKSAELTLCCYPVTAQTDQYTGQSILTHSIIG